MLLSEWNTTLFKASRPIADLLSAYRLMCLNYLFEQGNIVLLQLAVFTQIIGHCCASCLWGNGQDTALLKCP